MPMGVPSASYLTLAAMEATMNGTWANILSSMVISWLMESQASFTDRGALGGGNWKSVAMPLETRPSLLVSTNWPGGSSRLVAPSVVETSVTPLVSARQ